MCLKTLKVVNVKAFLLWLVQIGVACWENHFFLLQWNNSIKENKKNMGEVRLEKEPMSNVIY